MRKTQARRKADPRDVWQLIRPKIKFVNLGWLGRVIRHMTVTGYMSALTYTWYETETNAATFRQQFIPCEMNLTHEINRSMI